MLQVIFVDSCYFCAFDVLEMLVHSNANLVCAMDMVRSPSGIAIASHRTATTHRNRGRACGSSHAVHVRCPLDAVRLVHAARHFSGVRARRTHARTPLHAAHATQPQRGRLAFALVRAVGGLIRQCGLSPPLRAALARSRLRWPTAVLNVPLQAQPVTGHLTLRDAPAIRDIDGKPFTSE